MIVPPFTCPEHNRQILLVERPVGIPQPEHFRLSETRRGLPQDGQILVRNLYLSVDPAQRGWAADVQNYSATVALNSVRSDEHTSELQSLMRISYAVFCLKKKNK